MLCSALSRLIFQYPTTIDTTGFGNARPLLRVANSHEFIATAMDTRSETPGSAMSADE